jgi:hypothetical protein
MQKPLTAKVARNGREGRKEKPWVEGAYCTLQAFLGELRDALRDLCG